MTGEPKDFLDRADEALAVADATRSISPDAAASRAYYAAFFAVSAWFASQGHEFRKHTQLEAAVHRDLVHAGLWSTALGRDYRLLATLRTLGDYGGDRHVAADEIDDAITAAGRIVAAVRELLRHA